MDSNAKQKLLFDGDATFAVVCPLSELKKSAGSWTLAGDAQLLGYLQSFSNRILSESQAVQKQLDELLLNTKNTDVKLNQVFNDFNVLADLQFVENRVYDEDPSFEQPSVDGKPKVPELTSQEKEAEMLRIMMESVSLGIHIVGDSNVSNDNLKDRYSTRPLPALIGTPAFFQLDLPRTSITKNDVSSLLPNTPSNTEHDRLSQVSDDVSQVKPSSSLESNSKVDDISSKNLPDKPKPRDLFADDESNDGADDLFNRPAKLRGSNAFMGKNNDSTGSLAADLSKSKSQDLASSTSSSVTSENVQKQQKSKKVKSLFDDSDSDEDGDLFAQISNIVNKQQNKDKQDNIFEKKDGSEPQAKVPVGGVSVFGSNPGLLKQISKSSTKEPDEDGDDDDSIKNLTKFVPSSSSSSLESKTGVSKPSGPIKSVVQKKPISLFDDDDDDDDDEDGLFAVVKKKPAVVEKQSQPSPPQKQKPQTQLQQPPTQLQQPQQQVQSQTQQQEKSPGPPVHKLMKHVPVKSLFDEDDSGADSDDIFSILAKQKKQSTGAEKEILKAKNIEDKQENVPQKVVDTKLPAIKKNESTSKVKSLFDDDDDEEEKEDGSVQDGKKEEKKEIKPPAATTLKKSLFDDDEDGDDDASDLFAFAKKETKPVVKPTISIRKQTSPLKMKEETKIFQENATNLIPEKNVSHPPNTPPLNITVASGVRNVKKGFLFDDDDGDGDDLFAALKKTNMPDIKSSTKTTPTILTKPNQDSLSKTLPDLPKINVAAESVQSKSSSVINSQSPKNQSSYSTNLESETPKSPKSISKAKGDKISKLQTSLNINPTSLGPFSHKKIKKLKPEELNKEEEEEEGVSKVPPQKVTEIIEESKVVNITSRHIDDDDLDLVASATLHCLAKERPKLPGKRRPMTKRQSQNVPSNQTAVDPSKSEQSQPSIANNFFPEEPLSSSEKPQLSHFNHFHNTTLLEPSGRKFTEPPILGLFAPESQTRDEPDALSTLDKTILLSKSAKDAQQLPVKDSEVEYFFRAAKTDDSLFQPKFAIDNEPPPLFSDDDDDDNDEFNDLFGSSALKKSKNPPLQIAVSKSDAEVKTVKAESTTIDRKLNNSNNSSKPFDSILKEDPDVNEVNDILYATSKKHEESTQKKNLFSFDDEGEEEEGDIFVSKGKLHSDALNTKSLPEKFETPAHKPPITSISPSKTTNPIQRQSVFGFDDDDDDLFADVSLSKKTTSKAGATLNVSQTDRKVGHEGSIASSRSAVVTASGITSTTSSNPAANTANLRANNGNVNGEDDDDDLFSEMPTNKLIKALKISSKAVVKQTNLFGDNGNVNGEDGDDDEDLFSEMPTNKLIKALKIPSKAVVKQTNLFGDIDDDLFSSNDATAPISKLTSTTSQLLSKSHTKPTASNLFDDPLNAL